MNGITRKKMVLCIACISGYTEFIKFHKTETTYSESQIQRVLMTIMNSDLAPIIVNKLEGDALLMYCDSINFDDPKAIKQLVDKSAVIHGVFENEKALISTICPCNPSKLCPALPKLKIKILFTIGEVSLLQMANFTELSGVDVILIHRFMKSNVDSPEYTLLTEPLYNAVKGELENKSPIVVTLLDDVLGENRGYVFPFNSVAQEAT